MNGENYRPIRGIILTTRPIRYIRDIINFIRRGYILISERLDHALYAMINADACITFVRGWDAKRMRIVFQYIFTYALY